MKGRLLLDLREETILHFDIQKHAPLLKQPFFSVLLTLDNAEDSLLLTLAEGQAAALLLLLEQQFGRERDGR